jgi:hypothetical protein
MANDLTGDYDVVAAFSLGAVDRILAAMHRGNRLPHSLSMAVNDFPSLNLGAAAVSVVDKLGNAIADAARVKTAAAAVTPPGNLRSEEVLSNVDPVVNWRPDPSAPGGPQEIRLAGPGIPGGVIGGPGASIDFSYLSGVAQLQLGPPTMQLGRGETATADVHTPAMIHFIRDEHTRPMSDFMRGEVVTRFGVKQVASPGGTNIVVDLAGSDVHFNSFWSAVTLDPGDRTAIDQVLLKSVRNSFQPSTAPMPANVRTMHFKGFPTGGPVCAMMNVTSNNNPNPASVTNVFIAPDDQFALAVNGDSITGPFAAAVNAALDPTRVQETDTPVQIKGSVFGVTVATYNFHIESKVTILTATVQLVDNPVLDFAGTPGKGQILLTIPVQVRFATKDKPPFVPDPKNFAFTIMAAFTLTLNGRDVGLQQLGDVAVIIPKDVPDNEANPARAQATDLFNATWKNQQNAIQQQISKALNADGLQKFLKSLMNPASATPPYLKTLITPSPSTETVEVDPTLAYTSFEIQPAGIILHGSLSVPPWPAPYREFDKDPWGQAGKPEYRALNSWIPGGTIQEYDWSFPTATLKDTNKFVTTGAPPLTLSNNTICLMFSGTRITASGPVAYENAYSGWKCKSTNSPLTRLQSGVDLAAGNRPHVAVFNPRATPEQKAEIVLHISPWAPDELAWNTANFLVYFPDNSSAGQLGLLLQALGQSGRTDTATAILCVLTQQQLSSVQPIDGLMYADDAAAWEGLLEVRGRPAAVLLSPSGKIAWRHDGEIGGGELAQALHGNLAANGQFFSQFLESPLTIGQLSPNFLFETEPGERLTLRKLAGRPAVLVFWRSSSAPSMATIGNLHRAFSQPGVDAPLLVAINDGEDGEFARGLAAVEEGEVVIVPDPARQVSRAYGINIWPTTVFLDSSGVVVDIRFGLISGRELQTSVGSRLAPSNQAGKES